VTRVVGRGEMFAATATLWETRALQEARGSGKELKLPVRVQVVETSVDHPTARGSEDLPPLFFKQNWRGLSRFEAE
jgi:hypothetical protein